MRSSLFELFNKASSSTDSLVHRGLSISENVPLIEREIEEAVSRKRFLEEETKKDLLNTITQLDNELKGLSDKKWDEARLAEIYKKRQYTMVSLERLEDAIKETNRLIKSLRRSKRAEIVFDDSEDDHKKIIVISEITNEMLDFLARHPSYLYKLHSRKFEQLIARIFTDFGYRVELRRATHDGGKDLIIRSETSIGPIVSYVQCKRYLPERPVGIEVVRSLYGVQMADRINKSMIVTTSYFSPEAQKFASRLSFLMDLREYAHIVDWLRPYRKKT